jgi:hypothetical protein
VIKSRAITRLNRKADSPNSNASKNMAEREGFEPSVQVLARTTV